MATHCGGDVCGIVVLVAHGTFLTIPTVGIQQGGSFFVSAGTLIVVNLLTVSPYLISTFHMLPNPIPYSESKSLLLWQRLIRLVSCFLIVLKPVHLLAQLCKRVLHGIRFLSAFLGGAEIGFFSLVLLVPTAMLVFVCGMHAPMLLAEVAMLLCACFLGNLARILGTRPLASFLAPCGKTFCWIVHWIFLG